MAAAVTTAAPAGLPAQVATGRTLVMGVVNVTPDSFSDGGHYLASDAAVEHGLALVAEGADLVDVYAKRPQVQERMTSQIADALNDVLKPRGVLVVIEAEHLCMAMRGIRKPGTTTVTSAVRGIFRDSAATRSEAMSLVLGR